MLKYLEGPIDKEKSTKFDQIWKTLGWNLKEKKKTCRQNPIPKTPWFICKLDFNAVNSEFWQIYLPFEGTHYGAKFSLSREQDDQELNNYIMKK